jgi:hypothetical protein
MGNAPDDSRVGRPCGCRYRTRRRENHGHQRERRKHDNQMRRVRIEDRGQPEGDNTCQGQTSEHA